ncbi:MAG: hypothetical protein RLY43_1417 [Bacteroidota bacterium]|jgi:hypothetical protein
MNIHKLFEEGHSLQVLDILIKYDLDLTKPKALWNSATKSYNMGICDYEELKRVKNQVNFVIAEVLHTFPKEGNYERNNEKLLVRHTENGLEASTATNNWEPTDWYPVDPVTYNLLIKKNLESYSIPFEYVGV